MKTLLLENNNLLSSDTEEWVKSFDLNYVELNSSVREYDRSDDLHFFGLLINPELERVVTSSAFPTQMDYRACVSFDKGLHEKEDDENFYQLEYFSWLIFNAVRFREKNKLPFLTIEINYLGENFLQDLKDGDFGDDTIMYLKLMLRQQDNVQVNLYKDFKLVAELKEEEDLKL